MPPRQSIWKQSLYANLWNQYKKWPILWFLVLSHFWRYENPENSLFIEGVVNLLYANKIGWEIVQEDDKQEARPIFLSPKVTKNLKNSCMHFSRVRPTLRHPLVHQLFKSFLFFLESNPTYAKHIKNKVISFWYVFDFHYLCTKINILYKIRYDFIFQNSIKERDCHRSGPSTQSRWD